MPAPDAVGSLGPLDSTNLPAAPTPHQAEDPPRVLRQRAERSRPYWTARVSSRKLLSSDQAPFAIAAVGCCERSPWRDHATRSARTHPESPEQLVPSSEDNCSHGDRQQPPLPHLPGLAEQFGRAKYDGRLCQFP